MSAPTTYFTGGITGSITATGEANGLLLNVNQGLQNARVKLGFSGSFTGCVVCVRVIPTQLLNFYPVRAVVTNGGVLISDSTNIALTDNTNQSIDVDASGCGQLEVYVVSGTPTAMTVEARQTANDAPFTNILNTTVTGATNFTAASTVNVSSATAFVVGPNGTTNPTFKVVTNTASAATGLALTSAAAGSGVALKVITSGTNESITIDAAATGGIKLNGVSGTGPIQLGGSTGTGATGVAVTPNSAGSGVLVQAVSSATNESIKLEAKGSGSVIVGGTSTGIVSIGRGSTNVSIFSSTKTALGTVQNTTPTAAQLLGGELTHNSTTGAGTATLPTGTLIDGAIPGVTTGDNFECVYCNTGSQTVTITSATGLTLLGTVAIPSGKNATLNFYRTGTATYDVVCMVSA